MNEEKKVDEKKSEVPVGKKETGILCPKCKGRSAIRKRNSLKCPSCGFQQVSV